ncbi:hypothetical protein QP139_10460, partial [Winkia sp. UMB10116]|uniref:hypothetical protein n=1 Tax=Winkia sp. UMB10116 TaxID=3046355 RepID=UPI0025569877
ASPPIKVSRLRRRTHRRPIIPQRLKAERKCQLSQMIFQLIDSPTPVRMATSRLADVHSAVITRWTLTR